MKNSNIIEQYKKLKVQCFKLRIIEIKKVIIS